LAFVDPILSVIVDVGDMRFSISLVTTFAPLSLALFAGSPPSAKRFVPVGKFCLMPALAAGRPFF
jgi:hypothetical protein